VDDFEESDTIITKYPLHQQKRTDGRAKSDPLVLNSTFGSDFGCTQAPLLHVHLIGIRRGKSEGEVVFGGSLQSLYCKTSENC